MEQTLNKEKIYEEFSEFISENIPDDINTNNKTNISNTKRKKAYIFLGVSLEDVLEWLEDGKLRNVYNIICSMTSKDYVEYLSGIDRRVFNKYDSKYYTHLNQEDTERLLNAVNIIVMPPDKHKTLKEYPNIIYKGYEEQEKERQEEKEIHRLIMTGKIKAVRELMGIWWKYTKRYHINIIIKYMI